MKILLDFIPQKNDLMLLSSEMSEKVSYKKYHINVSFYVYYLLLTKIFKKKL